MSTVATSSTSSNNLSINVKLTEDNYSAWVYMMKTMLANENLLDITDPDVLQVENTFRALRAIQVNISEELVPAIMHYATAPKV